MARWQCPATSPLQGLAMVPEDLCYMTLTRDTRPGTDPTCQFCSETTQGFCVVPVWEKGVLTVLQGSGRPLGPQDLQKDP